MPRTKKGKYRKRRSNIDLGRILTAVSAVAELSGGRVLKNEITDTVRVAYDPILKSAHLPTGGLGGAVGMILISQLAGKAADRMKINPAVNVGGYRIKLL